MSAMLYATGGGPKRCGAARAPFGSSLTACAFLRPAPRLWDVLPLRDRLPSTGEEGSALIQTNADPLSYRD